MLTIDEFNATVTDYQRRSLTAGYVLIASMVIWGSIMVAFKYVLEGFLEEQLGKIATGGVMALAFLPPLVLFFVWISRIERAAWRDARLVCPHCGKMLARYRHVVVASRNCGHCGRRVLSEPDDAE